MPFWPLLERTFVPGPECPLQCLSGDCRCELLCVKNLTAFGVCTRGRNMHCVTVLSSRKAGGSNFLSRPLAELRSLGQSRLGFCGDERGSRHTASLFGMG